MRRLDPARHAEELDGRRRKRLVGPIDVIGSRGSGHPTACGKEKPQRNWNATHPKAAINVRLSRPSNHKLARGRRVR